MARKLYKVELILRTNGKAWNINGFTIVGEDDKRVILHADDSNEYSTMSKLKDEIGIIDSGAYRNYVGYIHFQGWCYDSDLEEMKERLLKMVISQADAYKRLLDSLLKHLP